MTVTEQKQWHLRRGQYLGEISALCFLRLPPQLSSLPLLLAGTGSQILVYDLVSGKILRSFQVFEGIRVHGISLENFHKELPGSVISFRVAIYGERRVKLFCLRIKSDSQQKPFLVMELAIIHSLPKFSHWVLDVCFLKDGATSIEDACYLAIGCGDNSICFWDILKHNFFSEVKSAEKCLLYSMRMLGNEIESLLIASGTIFNEIVVWKVVCPNQATSVESNVEDYSTLTSDDNILLPCSKYKDALICRLVGHEGSIFGIAWFSNGMKLVSVSDDRSARIWKVQAAKGELCKDVEDKANHLTGPVLFGHNARIWDCCIFDSLIITAGEDCTCRVWDHSGRELYEIKEHIGRGVWRCLYDPSSSLLVTAGFDSAIKVHQLNTSYKGLEGTKRSEDLRDRKEVFALSIPNSSGNGGLMDSKSEYVRCLQFSREDSLYVATNNGYLYHVSLLNNKSVKWTKLAHISKEAPTICMDLLSTCGFEDWVAVGDGNGNMTVILVVETDRSWGVELTLTWPAEKQRHLLGTYWCKSLENRFIFSADPGGRLKLWKLYHNLSSASGYGGGSYDVILIAEYSSCFGMRIMCVDASFQEELLVCGDIRGNVVLFSLPRGLQSTSISAELKSSPLNYFKGAHGVSSVCSVSICSQSSDQVEINSTGADGCICYLQHDRDLLNLEFIGMKQVKELSAIRSVFTTNVHCDNSTVGNYAVGFASANFILWNLTAGTKVLQITCGGWRRPHSYFLGDLPEMMHCFSYVKDDVIYIHRHWVPEHDRQIYPQNLHLQFHGREIHSLCFTCGHLFSSGKNEQLSESSWISTGCEDGTVRLTRYEPGMENWTSSQNLGEHVVGSAVRSLCFVSKMHVFTPNSVGKPNVVYEQNDSLEDRDSSILISVGAKRVVTAWKQIITMGNQKVENKLTDFSTPTVSSFSFQWLSSDMPLKHTNNVKRLNLNTKDGEDLSTCKTDAICIESLSSENGKMGSNHSSEDTLENDWRYLDVTAFLVKEAGSRISVCFVIVACSDATVTLRALVLPFRLWFDVALLTPSSCPVLALQHVVIPKHLPEGNIQIGNLYLAIAGSTDGSIAIWDLTECVENFILKISGLQMENCIESQKRPRTGRGSQGGRRWRSIDSHNVKKKPGLNISTEKSNSDLVSTESQNEMENHVCGTCDDNNNDLQGIKKDDLSSEINILVAVYVLHSAHQSGVNCLYVSNIKEMSETRLSFFVVSGGDDQAINCVRCDMEINRIKKEGNHHCLLIQNREMKFLCMDKITSAHSSAVKGIWTDGIWVFSVGLDQRVRCWKIGEERITEYTHLIISVPEPEALDIKICGRNHYQIAVAGRGMQMIEFRIPS